MNPWRRGASFPVLTLATSSTTTPSPRGETITFELTSGAAFIYGATTDNVRNDPSVQFAGKTE
ncbi:MAG TPA: hypothetical protein VEK57_16820 [Thermoanaerobaculia bacterium]|nr:hypothetical protein [Thermoanaerobaculia bacterium]